VASSSFLLPLVVAGALCCHAALYQVLEATRTEGTGPARLRSGRPFSIWLVQASLLMVLLETLKLCDHDPTGWDQQVALLVGVCAGCKDLGKA
jgi:hypothetical protein